MMCDAMKEIEDRCTRILLDRYRDALKKISSHYNIDGACDRECAEHMVKVARAALHPGHRGE